MLANTEPVGFDTETHRIALEALAPKIVCGTTATGQYPMTENMIAATADGEDLRTLVAAIFGDPEFTVVIHNAAFDLAVCAVNYPEIAPSIWRAIEEGRVKCTRIREKLLALATSGDIDFDETPDGSKIRKLYDLASLVKFYFGKDRSAEKKASDAWRLNYSSLEALPSSEWPKEAVDYAIEDASDALGLFKVQEQRRQQLIEERGIDPFGAGDVVENFRVAFDFALRMMSCRGFAVDNEAKAKIVKMLETELAPEKHDLLIELGILRPAEPPRPHKNNPTKMTVGKAESINKTKLKEYVEELAKLLPDDVVLKRTDKSERFPEGQLSIDAEWLEDHAHFSDVLSQYKHRQELQKLVTTEIPRMGIKDAEGNVVGDSPVVHPLFDCLKRTGRSSSYGDDIVPSFNCQNVHPAVRGCFVPRPGFLFWSADYAYMELCTLAQKCLTLFGQSKLAEIINAGMDPHGWLGAQLILRLDPDFSQLLIDNNVDASSTDAVYQMFMSLKKCGSPEWEAAFKHWRTFAKPTGLGYPGGLGPKTFVKYAKATYGIKCSLEEAKSLREAWKSALPEMPLYFDWINQNCIDPHNKVRTIENEDGTTRQAEVYSYFSPLGMYRARADYCAASNGAALQTPSAEGAGLAVWEVMRACHDPAMKNDLLLGHVFPLGFIHDEIVGEVRHDNLTHERMVEVARLMVEAFQFVVPDIKMKAQPVLMERWDKAAEPVFDKQGRLDIWRPKVKS